MYIYIQPSKHRDRLAAELLFGTKGISISACAEVGLGLVIALFGAGRV